MIPEPDDGIYDAMNKGIGPASGDIIGILNADDFYTGDQVLASVVEGFFVRPQELPSLRLWSDRFFLKKVEYQN